MFLVLENRIDQPLGQSFDDAPARICRKRQDRGIRKAKPQASGISESEIRTHVQAGSAIYTDALLSYMGLKQQDFLHETIDHAERYVDGQVHTNGLENFWSLLKRGLKATYISAEPFHLFRYLDEQVFRYNYRELPMTALDSSTLFLTS